MTQIILVGIGSGVASALLSISLSSGSPFALVLSFLASLPIFIAAIGWRHPAGLVGVLAGGLGLAVLLSPARALEFCVGIALPAWWLAYLALLARPGAEGKPEWYPIGRLVIWTAVIAAVLVLVWVLGIAGDLSDYRVALRNFVEQWLRALLRVPADEPLRVPNVTDVARLINFGVLILPPTLALSATVTTLVNLWLGARIVRRSGRLTRPWPDIAVELAYPRGTAAAVGVAALIGSFTSGLLALAGELLTTTLLAAFSILGLAVLHVVSRGLAARPILLVATYLFIFVFLQTWLLLVFALVGLAEQLFGIRARFLARHRSPSPPLDPTS